MPLTVPEVRRLLWRLVWGRLPVPDHVCQRSRWRRQHQAVAKCWHYQRRSTTDTHLQL
jgi:hypothetical protein